jgi:hypothetical protein
MQIILIYKNGGNGQVAFAANRQAPKRHYAIAEGVLTLTGYSDAILHKDAAELLSGDEYRLLTPQEQEALAQKMQQASMIQESAESVQEAESEQGEVAENASPAVPKQKKNGGG